MKKFIGFVIKEFYHIIRDFRTLLILFGMPIAQILIFGFAIRNEIRDVKIAILDKSKDVITVKLTNKILSSNYFVINRNLESEKDIETVFKEGKIKLIIVFEEKFGLNINKFKKANINLILDASDPNLANMILGYTSSIINDFVWDLNKSLNLAPFIETRVKMYYNPNLKSVFMFVPGLMSVILLLVSALMTSISITREKELGTMEVLLVSPLRPIEIIIGKVLPYLFLAFVNSISIVVLSKYIFELPIKGNTILLMIECFLFILTALSLGIFISTVSNSQQVAMMVSLGGLMLPTIMLSGYIFPVENMPEVLQWISNIVPAKWFIIIMKAIMLKGAGIEYIYKETLMLISMMLIFILASIKKFKIRLE